MTRSIYSIESSKKKPKGFDRLVLEDIKDTVEKSRADDFYFHNNRSNMTLGTLLSKLFGRGAYTRILSMVRPENLGHKALHEYYSEMYDVWNTSLDTDLVLDRDSYKDFRKKLTDAVKKYRKPIEDFYKSLGIIETPLNYTLEISTEGLWSFWEPEHNLMTVSPDRMPIFKRGGKYVIHTATGLAIGTHEFAHALQHEISKRCMPPGLSYDTIHFSRISHGPVCEGTATYAGTLGLQWMKKNMTKLGISSEDLRLVEVYENAYNEEKKLEVAHGLLEMEYFNKLSNDNVPEHWKIEAHKRLAEITGLKVTFKDSYRFDDPSFEEILLCLSYITGKPRIEKLANKVKKAIYPRNHAGKGVILQALLTGSWTNPKCQEEFIFKHYIPRALKDDVLEYPK
ncbi:hypothetical protein KY308_03145 [Candidatus Woesearchaeota archaeon]|nr:hypothetical protein [Candidatus Woesearchaeota archaeon]